MPSLEALREEWRQRARSRPVYPAMTFTEDGLVLGSTVLAKASADRWDRPVLADDAEARISSLLAIAFGKAVDPAVLDHIHRAAEQWSRGEICLALIQLAYTGLSKLSDEQSFRLFLADRALADGVAPPALLKACGIDSEPLGLGKAGHNPNQPRVPKGNPAGGQWTSDGGEVSPVRAGIRLAEYKVVKQPPNDAKVVIPRGGTPIKAGDPPTLLIAPRHADYRQVYAAGQAIASAPLPIQIALIRANLGQGGTYDFQRETRNPASLCQR